MLSSRLPPVVATSSIRSARVPGASTVKPGRAVILPSPSLWRKAKGRARCLAVENPKTIAPKAGDTTTSIASRRSSKRIAIIRPVSSTRSGRCAILIFSK